MKDSKNIRPVNDLEKKIIINSLSQMSHKFISLLEENIYTLLIGLTPSKLKNKRLSVYLIKNYHKSLKDFMKYISEIYSIGLYFGFIKRGTFFLSLEGSEFLYKNDYIPDKNQIIVNTEGEKSILYGNNILKKMILNFSKKLKKNEIIFVLNELKELIAIAFTKIDAKIFHKLESDDLFAQNLIDKGYYLREIQ